ncbi:glutamate--cysteine ligase (plasmid) [Streptomyces sp. BI20]|uniref:glutamate--cysteine ligase n=1 Tax=Streptomyces sp. BI20 TaxID=3403460 RepID=UPI003C76EE97
MRTVGVEEELLLVDEGDGSPLAVAAPVVRGLRRAHPADGDAPDGDYAHELHDEQVEYSTPPVADLALLREEIVARRAETARHAAESNARLVALATSPLPVDASLHAGERYRWMAEQFGLTAQEQLTCGCHVHVAVEDDDEGVAVLDRIRPWLPVLTALSANSPFWQGVDTGYASYRSRVWNRLPTAGPTEPFGTAAGYHALVRDMLATGVIRDKGMIWFDARLSASYPTVELRVADVCLDPDTPVLLAALARALVETAAREWRAGLPVPPVPTGLLRMAAWRAGRSGLDGPLLDPRDHREAPAATVVAALCEHVAEALADHGDEDRVRTGLARLLVDGTGARVQRAALRAGGGPAAMIDECARRTLAP